MQSAHESFITNPDTSDYMISTFQHALGQIKLAFSNV
jgi:hypothetical protein